MDHCCNFCKEGYFIPKNHINKLILLLKSKKKIFNYFLILNIPHNILKKKNIYVPLYSPEVLYNIRIKVNKIYNDVGYIRCSFCKKTACPSHFLWSNFINNKCIKCNKHMSVCGWCKTDICFECYEEGYS